MQKSVIRPPSQSEIPRGPLWPLGAIDRSIFEQSHYTEKPQLQNRAQINLSNEFFLTNSIYLVTNMSLAEPGISGGPNLAGCKIFEALHCVCEMALTGKT